MCNPAMHIVGGTNVIRIGPVRFQSTVSLRLLGAVQRERNNALDQRIGQLKALGFRKSQRLPLQFGSRHILLTDGKG